MAVSFLLGDICVQEIVVVLSAQKYRRYEPTLIVVMKINLFAVLINLLFTRHE